MGIELDEKAILACVRRGLDVVQADLNHGLSAFADGQFDFVVLSQTLQAVMDVQGVLQRDAPRRPAGDHQLSQHRLLEAAQATCPKRAAPRGPARSWATTGTTRPTSASFPSPTSQEFCRDQQIQIHQQIALDTEADCQVYDDPNLNADMAIVVLRG